MPCMCGDFCCNSCGPAQGNGKCPICREWASEGCCHINSRTGQVKRKYKKELDRIHEEELKAIEAEIEMDKLAKQYWESAEKP